MSWCLYGRTGGQTDTSKSNRLVFLYIYIYIWSKAHSLIVKADNILRFQSFQYMYVPTQSYFPVFPCGCRVRNSRKLVLRTNTFYHNDPHEPTQAGQRAPDRRLTRATSDAGSGVATISLLHFRRTHDAPCSILILSISIAISECEGIILDWVSCLICNLVS